MIVFLSFVGMVVLGLIHGLVLLPVILSLVGPKTGVVSLHKNQSAETDDMPKEEEEER